MSKDHPVKGKVIVIAGASSGFGRGAALALAEAGAHVVVAARRGDVLDALVAEITAAGGSAMALPTDVSKPEQVARLHGKTVQRFGRIDVWINNVGIVALGFFWDIPVEDHARVVEVNLTGLMYGAHAALTQFREQGEGILLNVGSVESEVPLAYQSSYAATKAGVLSLSRSLNEELRLAGEKSIKVGTIMPWAIDTPLWTHAANYTGTAPRMALMDDPQLVVDAIVAACTDPKEEQPVGPKARASDISHHLFPDLTERLSASLVQHEVDKAPPVPHTAGTIHVPGPDGTTVDGGIRERMKAEDSRS
jgi:short-subunit dehydrogenase